MSRRTDLRQPRSAALRCAPCARRTRSRYYVQCPLDEHVDHWPDERFWDELKRRLDPKAADELVTGPSIEKSIAPLRSFVAEPMRFGRHVPRRRRRAHRAADRRQGTEPRRQRRALSVDARCANITTRNPPPASTAIRRRALARVWKAVRFSWWMTSMLHKFPETGEFGARIQLAELDYLVELKGGDDVAVGELRRPCRT